MKYRKQEYKTTKKGRKIRHVLFLAELLFLAVILTGGSHLAMKEEKKQVLESPGQETGEEKKTDPIPTATKTPAFSWKDHTTIAHALGEVNGKTYLNSKEGFLKYYKKGVRLFEVDLVKTSDDVWVCRHSWNQSMGQWETEGKQILMEEEFLSRPLYDQYETMTLKELFQLLKKYPDAFVLLDSKQYSIRNYQKTIEDYVEYMEIAKEADAKEVLGQLIPEIYNEAMFPGTALLYQFPSYIYSLWQEYTIEELEHIGDFCIEKGIPAVTVYRKYWTKEVQDIFSDRGIYVYVYTVNDIPEAKKYLQAGAAGVCTDSILAEELVEIEG